MLWASPVRTIGQLIVGSSGNVGSFDLTTGTSISSFHWGPPGAPRPVSVKSLTVFGNSLYVAYTPFGSSTITIGVYDATTGAVINANFASVNPSVSGSAPVMAATADTLLVVNFGTLIRKFDAVTGAVLNTSLLGGALSITGLMAAQNTLFVGDSGGTVVTEYDIATGAANGLSFDSGLSTPLGMAIWRNYLLVSNASRVSMYNLTTGALVTSTLPNMSLFSGSLAVRDDTLYMGQTVNGLVSTYDLAHGRPLNSSFAGVPSGVTGLGIAAPEPTAALLLAGAAFPLLLRRRR